MIKLMKKLFLTIILCFFITSNYSFAGTYFFDNCDTDDGETRSSARIELNSNLVHIYSINRKTGKEVINGTARIKTVTDDKIVHEKTPWRILASKNVSHDRTSRLLIDVVDQVETYYPKSKKIVITMMIDNVYDKKKRKKLKKLGVTSYPFKFSKILYCQNVRSQGIIAKKTQPKKKKQEEEKRITEKPKKKEPKKKTPGNNKIVPAASGTGFFVSTSGHIISNHHVIEGCDVTKLSFRGKEIEADVLAVDKMNDLAILKANIKPNKVYSVATEDAQLLEDVIIAGYPLGKKVSAAIKTSKGSITSLAGYGDNYSQFQTDAALNQGNSGGPIINQKGNVIGVAVANYGKKAGVESFNFGIKSSTLKTFASANALTFLPPNNRNLSNKDLGKLITEGTVYLECYMTVAKIKKMISEEKNRKAFFSEYQ